MSKWQTRWPFQFQFHRLVRPFEERSRTKRERSLFFLFFYKSNDPFDRPPLFFLSFFTPVVPPLSPGLMKFQRHRTLLDNNWLASVPSITFLDRLSVEIAVLEEVREKKLERSRIVAPSFDYTFRLNFLQFGSVSVSHNSRSLVVEFLLRSVGSDTLFSGIVIWSLWILFLIFVFLFCSFFFLCSQADPYKLAR